jgi:hypothetical protein
MGTTILIQRLFVMHLHFWILRDIAMSCFFLDFLHKSGVIGPLHKLSSRRSDFDFEGDIRDRKSYRIVDSGESI